MVPGTLASVPLVILDWADEFIDAEVMPTGRLLINAEFIGEEIVAKRLGVGRYRFDFLVPTGYPNGTKIYMHQTAYVQPHRLRRMFSCGEINDITTLATREQLNVINEALKIISLDAGIPHTKDLPS